MATGPEGLVMVTELPSVVVDHYPLSDIGTGHRAREAGKDYRTAREVVILLPLSDIGNGCWTPNSGNGYPTLPEQRYINYYPLPDIGNGRQTQTPGNGYRTS